MMNDERSFERFVADHVTGAAGQVRLPVEFYDDIHAFTSRTRQRPEWLALIKEPPMRIDSTLGVGSPIARIAIIAATTVLMAVLGVGALIAGAQSPDVSPPTPDRKAAVYVTGTLGKGRWSPTPGEVTTQDGITQTRGFAFSGLNVTSSDPRLGGVYSYVGNSDEYPGGIKAQTGRTEIRDDVGAWVGASTEYVANGDLETMMLTGDRAYAGLTAYLVVDWGQPDRPFTGIIFPGEMPEPPPVP